MYGNTVVVNIRSCIVCFVVVFCCVPAISTLTLRYVGT